MFKLNKLSIAIVSAGLLIGCSETNDDVFDNNSPAEPTPPDSEVVVSTAPTIPVVIQSNYLSSRAKSGDDAAAWETMSQKYQENIITYNTIAQQYPSDEQTAYPGFASLAEYDASETYSTAATLVKFTDGERHGVFSSKWWTQGDTPSFDNKSGPWNLVVRTDANGNYLTELDVVDAWVASGVYVAGEKVKHSIDGTEYWFEAKYWTSGNEPILTLSSGGSAEDWESPWSKVDAPANDDLVTPPNPEDDLTKPPVCSENCDAPVLPDDPTVPPVIPSPEPEPTPDPDAPNEPEPNPPTLPELGNDNLPEEGYAFLRELSTEHWDWFFPMRSGRYNIQGGTRNIPPFAKEDGSTDVFTLKAFKEAVVEYNAWAASKGYKQFLNEGTKSQQAFEFISFWAKSSRETSGSWDNAPAPWIVNDPDAGIVWKGGLYWVEEVGYETNDQGISSAINYVDAGSAYKPEPGRSYYGRGIIQLSWNYNYGAFSEWLYNNGMMRELVTTRDTLLKRPDYVATSGKLSIMSGIWFWMTPQGAKPSSHDVIYGDMVHVSTSSQDQGLPQRNDGGDIPTEAGESYDEAVIAYRLGTVTNIVNGGLECNRAANWHTGPVQRISYFNAYAKYMNAQLGDVDVPTVAAATNVWATKVDANSPDNLKTASCYSQKSYYGW